MILTINALPIRLLPGASLQMWKLQILRQSKLVPILVISPAQNRCIDGEQDRFAPRL
jgi:hypothetical protein